MTPRIAWYQFLGVCTACLRILLILSLLGGIGFGGWWYFQNKIVPSPEFQLKTIQLTPNTAVSEQEIMQLSRIAEAPSIFEVKPGEIEKALASRPELLSVDAHRVFPGTLVVEVHARQPYAWVSCPSLGVPPRNRQEGLICDRSGVLYRCPAGQFSQAAELPVIELSRDAKKLEPGEKLDLAEFGRAVRLYEEAARQSKSTSWIDTIRQSRPWALELKTHGGTTATFGLANHTRQVSDFLRAMDHARSTNRDIESIQLIPERNIPVVYRQQSVADDNPTTPEAPAETPKKATPTAASEKNKPTKGSQRRDDDVRRLLDR